MTGCFHITESNDVTFKGTRKAAVLPEPVGAQTYTTSTIFTKL